MIICILKRILHKKKAIFIQLQESPLPPLTTAAFRMIICKSPAPHFDKGMKNSFFDNIIWRSNYVQNAFWQSGSDSR